MKKLLPILFLFSSIIFLLGAIFKIMHLQIADIILQIAFLAVIAFIGIAVYEIMQSKKINLSEKCMWVVGLIFLNFIIGIVYLILGRKRVVEI